MEYLKFKVPDGILSSFEYREPEFGELFKFYGKGKRTNVGIWMRNTNLPGLGTFKYRSLFIIGFCDEDGVMLSNKHVEYYHMGKYHMVLTGRSLLFVRNVILSVYGAVEGRKILMRIDEVRKKGGNGNGNGE